METSASQSSKQKASRILYIVLAGVLCVGIAVAGIALSKSQIDAPQNDDVTVNQTPDNTQKEDTNKLPVFSAPLSGTIAKRHDLTTPVYSATMQEYRVHRGLDIAAPIGTKVKAMAKGVVSDIYKDPLMGWCIVLSHNGNAQTIYCNLDAESAQSMEKGTLVEAGQVIGCVGESALLELADEAHLHLEMTIDGQVVNPLDHISTQSQNVSFQTEDVYED
ncbi:MAG: M23 family metallopeptidase [Clostridia bacterium]|nr:M23 family metallopeptidase [Clostridia bacterium]